MHILVEHDNGIKGQHGITIESLDSVDKIPELVRNYKNSGITIYCINFCNE